MLLKTSYATVQRLEPDEYHRRRHALVRFFEWNNAQDAEDLADEVFYRAAKSTTPDIDNWGAFLHGIAQNVLSESRRQKQTNHTLLPYPCGLPVGSPPNEGLIADIGVCLQKLSRADRNLILKFYEGKALERAKLARSLGLSDNALRIRVSRIRRKLATFFEQIDVKR